MTAQVVGIPSLITETTQVATGRGHMLGFYVASTTGGTLVFHDHASAASNAKTGTITPAAGWHALPMEFTTGLRVVVANTISVTIVHGNG